MSSIRDIALAKAIGGGGGDITVEPLSVTENGTTVAPAGTAYSPVSVNVQPTLQSKAVTQNGTVTPDSGYDGLSQVSVNVQPVLETLSVTDNGEYTPGAGVDGFSSVSVNVSGGGGGGASANAVNFRDYDGTIVQSYSAADFAALTAMPENPSHDGLTAQGWNWTLVKAQAYVAKYGRLEIGQMYITDDGKTRVYIHLEQGRTSPMLGVCPNGTVDVDWGDGTAHDTLTGLSTSAVQWTPSHAYAAPGDYVIKLTVTGSMGFYGSSSNNQYSGLLRYTSDSDTRNSIYRNAIRKVEIGSGVTSISTYAFHSCYNLASVTIPDSVTSIGSNAFNTCRSLTSIIIPYISFGTYVFNACNSLINIIISDRPTIINNNMFYSCTSLASVTIPDSVTTIESNAFQYCYNLASVTIPDSVTTIESNAFNSCYGIAEYHLTRTAPPTLSNTNTFTGIAADCVIYVPYSADHSILEAYKTASNWSTYASVMQEEPQ